MSDIDVSRAFYGLTMMPKLRFKEKRIAEIRERQRRERKEELYSYRMKSHITNS